MASWGTNSGYEYSVIRNSGYEYALRIINHTLIKDLMYLKIKGYKGQIVRYFSKCLFVPTITDKTVFVHTISTPTRH